jgi:hypothetical protein
MSLLSINVNEHTERKNGLTYLSWAWAWAEVLKVDPEATWDVIEHDGMPVRFLPDRKGMTKTCWLPVMNHRNQAIEQPNAFQVNTAVMRCLAKAIGMHGLGLYIYAGEDLPEDSADAPTKSRNSLDGMGTTSATFNVHLPGKDEPHSTHTEPAACVDAIVKMVAQVERNNKADAKEKIEKIAALKEANLETINRLEVVLQAKAKASFTTALQRLEATNG